MTSMSSKIGFRCTPRGCQATTDVEMFYVSILACCCDSSCWGSRSATLPVARNFFNSC